MSRLKDDTGTLLIVAEHHELWMSLLQHEQRLCLLAPRDHSKRLSLDTPIATPAGWTTMGELRVGDELFDENGRVCRTTAIHPVAHGDSYAVRFDDGAVVNADSEHLWLTWTKADRMAEADESAIAKTRTRPWPGRKRHPSVKTTSEIAATLRVGREWNHSIPVTAPLQLPDAALPVPPYLLGAWLGDGTTVAPDITITEPEMLALIEAEGYPVRLVPSSAVGGKAALYHLTGLRADLRALGVLGNKHVPPAYLRAGEGQRRALLAGLMDTDGTAAADGTVAFGNTNKGLIDAVFELASSLGFKPHLYASRARLNGIDHGPAWSVVWTPRVPVFRLTRKAAKLRPDRAQAFRTGHRRIVAVEKIADVPMRCITVDSPSHLYLAGRSMVPTHNTWTQLAYIAWRLWRHNRGTDGRLRLDNPEGSFEVIIFSSVLTISGAMFARLQQFLMDNEELFGDLLPDLNPAGTVRGRRRNDSWGKSQFKLRNGTSVTHKSVGSATRGLHPQLIVVDDILSDTNALTALQRGRVWRYLIGTIEPMPGPKGQLIVLGTAQHFDDALHRLRKVRSFKWVKFRAVNWRTKSVLWADRWSYDRLLEKRDQDPVIFSREYQNDPRDDASSMFPYSLTQRAVSAGEGHRFVNEFPNVAREAGDWIVGGQDIAISEAVGADFTVIWVQLYNRFTQKRRLLWACQKKGLDFDDQVQLLRDTCRNFNLDVMVVEDNNMQKWLGQHVRKFPETATRVFGHTTGIGKSNMVDGVPSLKLVLQNTLLAVPTGDPESEAFVKTWRSEAQAFGWVEGKLMGAGEHDDTVMAWWLAERAVRMVDELVDKVPPQGTEVSGESMGMRRVTIGADI